MYQYLDQEYGHLVTIAKLYGINLSEADKKEKYGDRFGAQENDINLDLCGTIHVFLDEAPPEGFDPLGMKEHAITCLRDWGYPYDDIAEAIANTNLEVES